jgi:hypothetical protein
MPPSGYDRSQAEFIVGFLSSCADALEKESAALGVSTSAGLRRECADIAGFIETGDLTPAAIAVLDLTRAFYSGVAGNSPEVDYQSAVSIELDRVRSAIADIHIAPSQMKSNST